ncbi:MAG: Hsp20/alpha crystallin family protein, partial [Planctomycetia bacterium]|nr:Hsp20/alpha crystallin family protein [Planctomycetia bacterium]
LRMIRSLQGRRRSLPPVSGVLPMPTLRDLFQPPFGGFVQPLEDIRDDFDRLWTTLAEPRPLQERSFRRAAAAGLAVPVNVSESDDAVVIEAELPGLAAGDVDISVSGDELVLKGTRPAPHGAASAGDGEPAGITWHRRERGTGAFERRITLPVAVDADRVEGRLVDGVLTVTCPKAPECQPRKVTVRSA